MCTPLITIAIPNYNYARYLRKTLDSVVAQVGDDIEILISDNNSSDESWSVIQSYSDIRIRKFKQPKNIGLYANWNYLLKEAKGMYFKLLQADDWIEENFMEEIRKVIKETNPCIIFSGYHNYLFESKNSTLKLLNTTAPSKEKLLAFEAPADYKTGQIALRFSQPDFVTIKCDLARLVGGYVPETIMRADYLFVARCLLSPYFTRCSIVEAPIVSQRSHGANDRGNYTLDRSLRDEMECMTYFRAAGFTWNAFIWKSKIMGQTCVFAVWYLLSRNLGKFRKICSITHSMSDYLVGLLASPFYILAYITSRLRILPSKQLRCALDHFLFR